MKKYRQRDIVLIEVPFAEGKGSKIRPVLIISNSKLYDVSEFVFLPLTGTSFKDVLEFALKDNMVIADFPKPSYVRINKIASLDKRLIVRKVNELNPQYFEIVIRKLSKIFEIE